MYKKFIQRKLLLGSLMMVAILGLLSSCPIAAKAVTVASPTTIFSDGFETNTFNAWTSHGTNWNVTSGGAEGGTYKSAVIGSVDNSSLEKNIPTVGFNNINLSYWYRINKALECSGSVCDHVYVQWSTDGSNWVNIADYNNIDVNSWTHVSFSLASNASNNSGFRFRFLASLSSGSDEFYLDNVVLTGGDIAAPVIAAHNNITVAADSLGGATVNYSLPTATDNLDSNVTVNCDPAPSTYFTLGAHTVTCNASDAAGNHATPTTFTITVTPGAVSADNSIVSTNPGQAVTDAGTSYMITVTAKDQFGNLIPEIPGSQVILSSTGSDHTFSQPSLTTDSKGQTTGLISSTKAETKTISCTINGILLTHTATLVFIPGTFHHITVTPTTQNVVYGETYNFSAQGYDANNNPISGLTYTWSETNGTGSGTIDQTGLFTTQSVGTVTVKATSGSITGTANVTITPRPISITADAKTKVYGESDPALTYQITSGNLVYGDDFTGSLTRVSGENVGFYNILQGSLALSANYTLTYNSAQLEITKASVTISATADNKIYDGTTIDIAHLTVIGAVSGDDLDATYSSANFDNKNIGTGKTVTVAGIVLTGAHASNYSFNNTTTAFANITARALTVTAATDEKVYDSTVDSNKTPIISNGSLAAGDSIAMYEEFADKNVGENKTLIPSATITDGNGGNNYAVTFVNDETGSISPKTLTITATGQDKFYDGNTDAQVTLFDDHISGDDISTAYANANFTDASVGNHDINVSGITVSGADADNYSYNDTAIASANINPLVINVTAEKKNKVYGSDDPALTYTFTPELIGDDEFSGSLTRDKGEDVGTYEITQGTLVLSSNYDLQYNEEYLTITKARATVSVSADDKTYDGDTTATVNLSVSGAMNGDILSADYSNANFADRNVGTNKTVTISGITLSGDNVDDYDFNGTATAQADITARALTISAVTDEKIYDGNTSSSIEPIISSGDLVGSDTIVMSQSFADKNVGDNKTLIPTATITDGNEGNNYAITFVNDTTGSITAKTLTIIATGIDKIYDGNTSAQVTLSDNRVNGDILTLNYSNANFSDANVGNHDINVSEITVNGADADNYLYNDTAVANANINPLVINVTAEAKTKVYGTDDPALTYTFTPELIGDDQFTGALTREAGETVGSYAITQGTLALSSNYDLQYTGANLTITKADPILTWTNPADIVAGTVLSNTQLNATADVAGDFTYTPAVGTQMNTTGTYTLNVSFVPTDTLDYNSATKDVSINVYPAPIAKIILTTPTSVVVPGPALISIIGEDQFNNIVTNDNATQVVLSADNGGAYDETILTLAAGLAQTNLNKTEAGTVHVTATSGTLAPVAKTVQFTSADTTGPIFQQIYPAKEATNVSINSPIFIIFNEPLKSETITSTNVKLMKVGEEGDTQVAATVSLAEGDERINITPNSPLDYSSQYYFVLSGVTDKTGNLMSPVIDDNNSGFTTGEDTADHTAPTVVAVWPTGTAVDINVKPYIDFSEAMQVSTLTEDNIQLFKVGDSVAIPAVINIQNGGTRAEIEPALSLDYNANYYVVVKAAVQDLAGNNLAAEYTSTQFTTMSEPTAELAVTNIANLRSWAVAGGGFTQGWKWRFDVTVPSDENNFYMRFNDWTNAAGNVIPAAGNIRYYTAQGDHGVDNPIVVTGNNYPTTPIVLNGDLDNSSAGKQIQVYVEVQVPENATGGSYSTSYQVKSLGDIEN